MTYAIHGRELATPTHTRSQDHSLHMLRRTWMLGPKRKGPNILAWRDPTDAECPSFFRDPSLRVAHVGAAERRLYGDDGVDASEAADSSGDEAASAPEADAAHAARLLVLPVRDLTTRGPSRSGFKNRALATRKAAPL